MNRIDNIAAAYSELQKKICRKLESADKKARFGETRWDSKIGSGCTRVMENGAIIEKGAVNFSFVKGDFSKKMEKILGENAEKYAATGISSILHPNHPYVPIIHMNVRYFALDNGISWFGGGIDLTPHIIDEKEAGWFHQALKNRCDKFNPTFYPDYKRWADDYYFLPHRNETRGVGGIFFDRIKPDQENSFDTLFKFTLELAKAYPVIYAELMKKNHSKKYSEREKNWQNLRRGRYVEFNLIHDRGTKFGLESGGNTESILVSLPANASWAYRYEPEPGGFEEKTLQQLKKDIDWINFANK